jgi:hypothetical protein
MNTLTRMRRLADQASAVATKAAVTARLRWWAVALAAGVLAFVAGGTCCPGRHGPAARRRLRQLTACPPRRCQRYARLAGCADRGRQCPAGLRADFARGPSYPTRRVASGHTHHMTPTRKRYPRAAATLQH